MRQKLNTEEKPIHISKMKIGASLEVLNKKHCHDSYEMLFVMQGEGKFVVEGKEYLLGPRRVMITKPLEYHYVTINPEIEYERYVIRFTEGDLYENKNKLFNLGYNISYLSYFDFDRHIFFDILYQTKRKDRFCL